jgi:hypothetical protein
MNILSAWKDSLSVFAPKNFGRFLWLWVNTIKQSYVVFFKYWWWLLPVVLVLKWCRLIPLWSVLKARERLCSAVDFEMSGDLLWYAFEVVTVAVLLSSIYFIFFLCIRPSVERKNFYYFSHYWMHAFYYILSSILIMYGTSGVIKTFCITPLGGAFLSIIQYVFALFLLDSDGSWKAALYSLWRAIKMVFCNLQYMIIMTLVLIFLSSIILEFCKLIMLLLDYHDDVIFSITRISDPKIAISFLGQTDLLLYSAPFLLLLLSKIILFSFIANFYTQKVYEQYKLYFKENN